MSDETQGPDESAGSPGSSTGSSAGSEFFADPGPGFDPDARAAPVIDEPAAPVAWEVPVVEGCLVAQGQVLHTVAGKAPAEWIYTRDELRAIAPPLTRILNRYDATRAAAGTGDEIAVLLGVGGYVGRSIRERRAVIAAERAAQEDVMGGPVYDAETAPADFTEPPDDGAGGDRPPIHARGVR